MKAPIIAIYFAAIAAAAPLTEGNIARDAFKQPRIVSLSKTDDSVKHKREPLGLYDNPNVIEKTKRWADAFGLYDKPDDTEKAKRWADAFGLYDKPDDTEKAKRWADAFGLYDKPDATEKAKH